MVVSTINIEANGDTNEKGQACGQTDRQTSKGGGYYFQLIPTPISI